MSDQQVRKVVGIVLIIGAAILVIGVLIVWIMPSTMGGMMRGGMMGSMSSCMGVCIVGPLLLATVLVILAVVLLRRDV